MLARLFSPTKEHSIVLSPLYVLLGVLAYASSAFSQTLPLATLQKNYMTLQFGMFCHFNMSTFQGTGVEWAEPTDSPNLFNPDSLNLGQWADAAKAAGMKYMVLVPKHHDGFCLWNSAYTDHSVAHSTWRGGKGDVVREFVDSVRSRGLKPCFYFSIWDRYHNVDNDTTYIKNQLKELLTNYGPITMLWLDGWNWHIPYSAVPFAPIYNYIKSLQPNLLVINNNHEGNLVHTDIVEYEKGSADTAQAIPAGNTTPSELCQTVSAPPKLNWFYDATNVDNLQSAATLSSLLKSTNKNYGNLLLDVTPTPHGTIPANQVKLIAQLGMAPTSIAPNRRALLTGGTRNGVLYGITASGAVTFGIPTETGERLLDIRGRQFGVALQAAAAEVQNKN